MYRAYGIHFFQIVVANGTPDPLRPHIWIFTDSLKDPRRGSIGSFSRPRWDNFPYIGEVPDFFLTRLALGLSQPRREFGQHLSGNLLPRNPGPVPLPFEPAPYVCINSLLICRIESTGSNHSNWISSIGSMVRDSLQ